MRIKQFDVRAWSQLAGTPAAFVAIWLVLVRLDFPEIPLVVNLVVAVFLAGAGFALILGSWSRFGGYGSYRALRHWVRYGPDPDGVSPDLRMLFLRRQPSENPALGWLWIALGILWAVRALPEGVHGAPTAVGNGLLAAFWAVSGTARIIFARRWGQRIKDLMHHTQEQIEEPGSTPPLDPLR